MRPLLWWMSCGTSPLVRIGPCLGSWQSSAPGLLQKSQHFWSWGGELEPSQHAAPKTKASRLLKFSYSVNTIHIIKFNAPFHQFFASNVITRTCFSGYGILSELRNQEQVRGQLAARDLGLRRAIGAPAPAIHENDRNVLQIKFSERIM